MPDKKKQRGQRRKLLALPDNSSFVKARNITTGLSEKGYAETICEDGDCVCSTIWFYGDL